MTLTHGSLFTGIGGIDLGFERAGIETIWQVEYDDYATKVLEKHWPNITRYRDIAQVDFTQVAPVDILSGGFPCQDVSYAGKRAGIDGSRSGLWREFYRAICEIRPRYVVVENVPGLLSSGFGRVLGDLAASGYDAEWDCLPAAAFGAPHLRYRVFLIAYAAFGRNGKITQPNQRAFSECDDEMVMAYAKGNAGELRQPAPERPGGFTNSGEVMADASRGGCDGEPGVKGEIAAERGRTCEGGQVMANAGRDGLAFDGQSRNGEVFNRNGRGISPDDRGEFWAVEPGVGRITHGLPGKLDGLNAWGEGWEDGIPRVATGVKNRVDRLKCLGNAVVPQVAEYIGRLIVESER